MTLKDNTVSCCFNLFILEDHATFIALNTVLWTVFPLRKQLFYLLEEKRNISEFGLLPH